MKFNRDCFVEKCISSDITRLHLASAHLDVEKKRLVATDGHCMAIVPIETDDHDVTGPVSADALKAARKAAKTNNGDAVIVANGAQVVPNGPTYARPDLMGCKFPPYEQVIPEYRTGADGTYTITFNVDLLAKVADAIGTAKNGIITITCKGALDPIVVQTSATEAIGVLMPARR